MHSRARGLGPIALGTLFLSLPAQALDPVLPSLARPLERARAADPYVGKPKPPEEQSILKTKAEDKDVVHSVAYVHAPLPEVFTALKDPSVLVSRNKLLRSWSAERKPDETIRISHEVRKIITVNFDQSWKLTVLEGTLTDPKAVLARGRKTAGTKYIRLLEDSILAMDVGDGVTRLEFVRHQNIVSAGGDEAEAYLRDVFLRLRAKVHGQPLPPVR